MKKAGSSSKDRLAKSGNPKKRTPSGTGLPSSSTGGTTSTNGTSSSSAAAAEEDPPVVIWPEWSDAEIAAKEFTTKHPFEDPEGLGWLPRSLRGLVDTYKRPGEFVGEGGQVVGIGGLAVVDEYFHGVGCLPGVGFGGVGGAGGVGMMRMGSGLERGADIEVGRTDEKGDVGQVVLDSTNGGGADEAVTPASGDKPDTAANGETNGNESETPIPSTPAAETRQPSTVIPPQTPSTPSTNLIIDTSTPPTAAPPTTTTPSTPLPPSLEEPQTPEEDPSKPLPDDTPQQPSAPDTQETLTGTSKLFLQNRHLTTSPLMLHILSTLHFLHSESKSFKSSQIPDEFCPWDAIYPKGKDLLPAVSQNGKYILKLWVLGSWRKVTVDDRVPFDAEGRPLLISSPVVNEIWLLLLCKGFLKVAGLSYKEPDTSPEFGDFDAFHCLKGWLPERFPIQTKPAAKLWPILSSLNIRSLQSSVALGGGPTAAMGAGPPRASNVGVTQTPMGAGAKGGPGDRSTIASSNSQRLGTGVKSNPYVVVFAYREGEEPTDQIHLPTLPYPFRIIDIRESVVAPDGIMKETSLVDLAQSQKMVKVKGYFTCGSVRVKRSTDARGKVTEEVVDAGPDGTECWIGFAEFLKTFRHITIFHSQGSFKTMKSMQFITDAAKPNDSLRVPQLLYLSDPTKEAHILVVLSTYLRVKSETSMQANSVYIEQYDWKAATERKIVLRAATNACLATYLHIPAGQQAYRFVIDCTTSYSVSVWSRDDFALEDEAKYLTDRLDLSVKDVDETFPAQAAGSWFSLFKNVLHFTEPTVLAASVYVPDSMQYATSLHMFDNDTGEEVPQVFFNLKPRLYLPNKEGYILVGESRTSQARPAGKWKLRLISEPVPIATPERPLEISVKPLVHDFEDVYVPNKHNILFRYVVKVKDAPTTSVSMQLSFSMPTVWVTLQMFHNDVEVASVRGKGLVTVHAWNLVQGEDALPVVPAKVEKGGKEEKGGKDKDGKDKGGGEKVLQVVGGGAGDSSGLGRHKYIVQASVDQLELTKIGISNRAPVAVGGGGDEPTRPTSRGAKATSAAKKKKPSISAGGAAAGSGGGAGAGITPGGAGVAAGASSGEEGQKPVGNEPSWKLRMISTDTASLVVARDTEKEDRYKAIKESWEASQPGRSSRARESRDMYLKMVEAGQIQPTMIAGVAGSKATGTKPWTIVAPPEWGYDRTGWENAIQTHPSETGIASISSSTSAVPLLHSMTTARDATTSDSPTHTRSASPIRSDFSRPQSGRTTRSPSLLPLLPPRIQTDEEITLRQSDRDRLVSDSEKRQEEVRRLRAEDRDRRSRAKVLQSEKVDEKSKDVEELRKFDFGRRDTYRQRVIREIEDAQAKTRAAMEAAMRAAESAADQVAAEEAAAAQAAAEKNKKKGGKR